ncbi:MAG: LPS-assembly protein LptD, partial [Paramuribaculum sp.]|nr:LPS-assembly protein LptD [Paramuribaculum sp.]
MRHSQIYIILISGLLWLASAFAARSPQDLLSPVDPATAPLSTDSVTPQDSMSANPAAEGITGLSRRNRTRISSDSISGDSAIAPLPAISKIRRERADLDAVVEFESSDSLVMEGSNKAYLFGNGKVTYGKIKLDAACIDMDMNTSVVYAVGRADSLGEVQGSPVFDDNGTSYESKTMRYNFETGKGFITDVVTQQGEGYLTGGRTKKIDDNVFYSEDGRYSTCSDHEHPHFYFQLTKAKVKPGKDIVVGPAYMVLAGLPLPLAVPFGYFPFT